MKSSHCNKDIIECIKELNAKLEIESEKYSKDIQSLQPEEFELIDEDIKRIEEYSKNYNKKAGIYYFQIKFNKKNNQHNRKLTSNYLAKQWDSGKRQHIPRIIKEKVNTYNSIIYNRYYPFYIGKSADLGKRIREHLSLGAKSKTAGLKLDKINSGIFKDASYRLGILDLDDFAGECYWVVEKIEANLRESINPICGKQ